jgi:hypothetical protein
VKIRLDVLIVTAVMGMTLAGCGGGGAKVHSEVTTVTTGQQLIDLKNARDKGAMSQDEYDRERKKVLSKE